MTGNSDVYFMCMGGIICPKQALFNIMDVIGTTPGALVTILKRTGRNDTFSLPKVTVFNVADLLSKTPF
jgi:hypothetical protein